jgi:hypothetical protein
MPELLNEARRPINKGAKRNGSAERKMVDGIGNTLIR